MKELIKTSFELFCKKRWLKAIDKEIRKCNKLSAEHGRHKHILDRLVERYNELYDDDPIRVK